LASVSGPIEVRLAAEQASKATVQVSVRPYAGIPGIESKRLASHIQAILSSIIILTQNPRTLIQIVIQSLTPQPTIQSRQEFSKTLSAACINATMLALLNAASFPLKAVVCAVAVGHSPDLKKIVLNPQSELDSSGCFVFLFGADDDQEETIWTDWKSSSDASPNLMKEAREVARVGARRVHKSIKESIGQPTTTLMQID